LALGPSALLALQSSVGNAATTELLLGGPSAPVQRLTEDPPVAGPAPAPADQHDEDEDDAAEREHDPDLDDAFQFRPDPEEAAPAPSAAPAAASAAAVDAGPRPMSTPAPASASAAASAAAAPTGAISIRGRHALMNVEYTAQEAWEYFAREAREAEVSHQEMDPSAAVVVQHAERSQAILARIAQAGARFPDLDTLASAVGAELGVVAPASAAPAAAAAAAPARPDVAAPSEGDERDRDEKRPEPARHPAMSNAAAAAVAADDAEWDVDALEGAVRGRGLAGVCNAMTSTWLAGLLLPSVDRTGIAADTWQCIVGLKVFLDAFSERHRASSEEATRVFLVLAEAGRFDAAWLRRLTPENARATFAAFDREPDDESDGDSDGDSDSDTDGERAPAAARVAAAPAAPRVAPERRDIAGPYDRLGAAELSEMIEEVLEDGFHLRAAFRGLVVIKAEAVSDDPDRFGNHQFGVSYTPGPDLSGTLRIFDQNAGLREFVADSDDAIVEHLAAFIHAGYVARRMDTPAGASTSATIVFRLL
jgi:hypothetical protein